MFNTRFLTPPPLSGRWKQIFITNKKLNKMASTLLSFENAESGIQFGCFDADTEMPVSFTDKGKKEMVYYLSASEVKSLHKFLNDHLETIEP